MRNRLLLVIRLAVASMLLFFVAAPAQAQTEPAIEDQGVDSATPRLPDGRVNLGSAPGKKGYWQVRGLGGFPRANDIPFQPWAKALYDYRSSKSELYPPLVNCKATGGPAFFNTPPGFELVDVPELKSIFILNIAGPHSWRVIYMDGRQHPTGDNVRPSYLGHSVGRWEGDTLVIDSVGFNEKIWVIGAFPSTAQLHIVERISRPSLKTLMYEATIDDPGAYTKPWSGAWTITEKTASKWTEGDMFEYICQDSR